MASQFTNHGRGLQSSHHGSGDQHIVQQHNTFGDVSFGDVSFGDVSFGDVSFGDVGTSSLNQKLLSALRETDPRDDKSRIERTKGGLLRDSYRWILNDETFVRWRDDPESNLLWIRGDPGKGKTMLMCGIIDELRRYEAYKPLHFFCQATNSDMNNASSVLRGLLYSFLAQHPESCDLVPSFRQRFEHARGNFFAEVNVWDALNSTFNNELLSHEAFKDVVIIIDAMDECTHDLKKLLDFVVGVSSHHNPKKVIVSSRKWLQIEETMRTVPQITTISLEDNRPAVSEAVSNYIRNKTDKLALQREYSMQEKEQLRSYLLTNAHDTFLWVALVIEQLEDTRGRRARHKMMRPQDLPPGLGPFFQRMIDQIFEDEEDHSEDVDLCIQVLSVTSSVYRPVTLMELESLIRPPQESWDPQESLKEIIMLCRSILTIDNDIVYFVHQSAKDFLLQHHKQRIMPNGTAQVHRSIFKSSLLVMSSTLRRDVYDLKSPGAPVPKPPPNQRLAPAVYSCLYWVDHLQDGDPTEQQLLGLVLEFLKTHYLHWLEALSLLEGISGGIEDMVNLLSAFQRSDAFSCGTRLVEDALRFIRYHRVGIEYTPLQVYYSALLFSPTNSIIRNHFQHEIPDWVAVRPPKEEWSTCFLTLEGHTAPIETLVYSPDGAHIISQSINETIIIWDANTGRQCTEPLVDMGRLQGVVTSSKSICTLILVQFIGIYHGQIALYNPFDRSKRTFPIHSGADRAVFSRNAEIFALIRNCETFKFLTNANEESINNIEELSRIDLEVPAELYDANTGCLLRTFGKVNLVVFSPFQDIMATTTNGKAQVVVRIWDYTTGQCLQTFEWSVSWISMAAFSNHGQQLVCCAHSAVIIWDISKGQRIRTFQAGSSSRVVALSQDGTRLVAEDSTLWDTKTGKCVATLERFSLGTFSRDNKVFAARTPQNTVQLWDLTAYQGQLAPNPDIQTLRSSPQVRVSGDVKIHQSACQIEQNADSKASTTHFQAHYSFVTIAKVTNAKSPDPIRHKYDVFPVAVSPNGMFIVSASVDGVRSWDSKTGRLLSTSRHHRIHDQWKRFTCLSIRPDNETILLAASETTQNMVQIWDVNQGLIVRNLEISEWQPGKLTFANNNTLLGVTLSSHWFHAIEVWDWETDESDLNGKFEISWMNDDVGFSETGGQILTNVGTINLDSLATSSNRSKPMSPIFEAPDRRGYTVDKSGWVFKDSEKLLWLPSDYRPDSFASIAVNGPLIALGCPGNRLVVLEFQ